MEKNISNGRIYISGPMSGLPELNYPKFDQIAKELRSAGHKVFNPAEVIVCPDGLTEEELYEKYMEEDLKGLATCKKIYLLEDWHKSNGAKRELKKALDLKFEIIQEGEL